MKRDNRFVLILLIVYILFSDSISAKSFLKTDLNIKLIEKDSLKNRTYSELKKRFYNAGDDSKRAGNYAKAYLKMAKEKEDNIQIANGFLLLSKISKEEEGLRYADSVLFYGNKSKNKELLIKGNIQKGIHYFYYLAEYNKSLEKLLKAQKNAVEENNQFQQIVIKHHIGNLKTVTYQRKEALEIFRSNVKYFNENMPQNNEERIQYLKSLFRLANIYNITKKPDSAEIINKIGIKETFKSENKNMYSAFLACYGSTLHLSGKIDRALDSLKKSAGLIKNNKLRVATIYLIICKIHYAKRNFKLYENYLLKIDSMYAQYPEAIKETKIAYEALVEFYRDNNNDKQQLIFMNKLIKIDSVLDEKFKNVNKNIVRNYVSKNIL